VNEGNNKTENNEMIIYKHTSGLLERVHMTPSKVTHRLKRGKDEWIGRTIPVKCLDEALTVRDEIVDNILRNAAVTGDTVTEEIVKSW